MEKQAQVCHQIGTKRCTHAGGSKIEYCRKYFRKNDVEFDGLCKDRDCECNGHGKAMGCHGELNGETVLLPGCAKSNFWKKHRADPPSAIVYIPRKFTVPFRQCDCGFVHPSLRDSLNRTSN